MTSGRDRRDRVLVSIEAQKRADDFMPLQKIKGSFDAAASPPPPLRLITKSGTLDQINAMYVKAAEWSPEWDFPTTLPRENDRYLGTLEQEVEVAGGLNEFWDLTKWSGVPTPVAKLNRILGGGLKNGELHVIADNMGSGKTSLALQFILTALFEGRVGVDVQHGDAKAAKQSGDGTRYVKGPVKTWLKLGKNRFGEQGGWRPLLHYKGQTRFGVPGDDAARENPENQMALSSASGCER